MIAPAIVIKESMVQAATADIPGAGDVSLAENLSTQCVNQTCKLQGMPPTDDTDVISLPQGSFCSSRIQPSAAETAAIVHVVKNRQKFIL